MSIVESRIRSEVNLRRDVYRHALGTPLSGRGVEDAGDGRAALLSVEPQPGATNRRRRSTQATDWKAVCIMVRILISASPFLLLQKKRAWRQKGFRRRARIPPLTQSADRLLRLRRFIAGVHRMRSNDKLLGFLMFSNSCIGCDN